MAAIKKGIVTDEELKTLAEIYQQFPEEFHLGIIMSGSTLLAYQEKEKSREPEKPKGRFHIKKLQEV